MSHSVEINKIEQCQSKRQAIRNETSKISKQIWEALVAWEAANQIALKIKHIWSN